MGGRSVDAVPTGRDPADALESSMTGTRGPPEACVSPSCMAANWHCHAVVIAVRQLLIPCSSPYEATLIGGNGGSPGGDGGVHCGIWEQYSHRLIGLVVKHQGPPA